MNLKAFGLGTAITAAAIAVNIVTETSAQAAQLTGVLNISGSVVTNSASHPTTLNFVDGNGAASGEFSIGFSSLGFDGMPGTIGGSGTIGIVNLDASGNLAGGPVTNFISGLTLNGQALSFTLTNFQLGSATVTNIVGGNTAYKYDPTLQGFFNIGQSYTAEGAIAARFIVPSGPNGGLGATYRGDFTAIASAPTPALVPGLLGVSVGMLRKRRSEATQSAEA